MPLFVPKNINGCRWIGEKSNFTQAEARDKASV